MSWRQQKIDALNGVANYEYFVGPLYDQIPKDVYAKGFHSDDRAQTDNTQTSLDSINLPWDRADLYAPHSNLQAGFHGWSLDEIAIEIAPIFVNRKLPQAGNLGTILRAPNQQLGKDLPRGDFSQRVAVNGIWQRDPGNFADTLVHQPEQPAAGRLNVYNSRDGKPVDKRRVKGDRVFSPDLLTSIFG